ncbi:hypothetical protein HYZ97_00750 [Candidatus Pacearchaeota archaeon]|nr:hypothetical protein [Candidatus Pacearchaeota archaeon]
MREHIKRFLFGGENFKQEFKAQLRLLIVVTLGFTIAFSWRQTFFDSTQRIVQLITHVQDTTGLSILSSLSITIISLIIIWGTTAWLSDED